MSPLLKLKYPTVQKSCVFMTRVIFTDTFVRRKNNNWKSWLSCLVIQDDFMSYT
jgi:hypothetical protein